MLLGIVLHGTLFLTATETGWPVRDAAAAEAGKLYGGINDAIHGFRMPVFFLLSGFFSALLWQRRSVQALVEQRVKRIVVPLAAACVTILPLVVGAYVLATGEAVPIWALPFVWIRDLGHLWFLWYLILMSAAFVLSVRIGVQFQSPLWWLVIPLTYVAGMHFIHGTTGGAERLHDGPGAALHACLFRAPCTAAELAMTRSAPLETAYAWLMCLGAHGAVPLHRRTRTPLAALPV